MTIEFRRWPEELAARYRQRGYWTSEPLTTLLEDHSKAHPERLALICGERVFSYGDLDKLSGNLAQRLANRGLGPGDTALVQLPNIAEFYITFFALLKIGVAPVNALFNHRKHEMSAYAEQIQPRVLVASRKHELFSNNDFLATLQEAGTAPLTALFIDGDDPASDLTAWMSPAPDNATSCFGPTEAQDVAFFQLSGGSTGTPKLIPRTHDDYAYSVRASARICELGSETVYLCALPAAHNFPLSSPGALGVFHAGGCVVLAPNPEPMACFGLIERHRVTMAALVPSAINLWLQAAPDHHEQIESLQLVQVGGAHFAETQARKVPEVLGCKLQQVFGMAEGLVNYTRLDDREEIVFATQGRPISPDDELRIIDEDGHPVPPGKAGRLATRGPYTFRGYYNSPEHNEEVFDADGFYYSGDLVRQTQDGYLCVVGRVKDQINRGGEKIAAEEIESLLMRHPDVADVAIVALQDASLGEKSCAVVVSRTPDLKPQVLRRHLMSLGVALYKLPDRFSFTDAIPLTAFGKPDKKKIRADLAA
ncbi:(2,3-dihydroxybenzoyl)adenylate synthase [Roseibium sp. RKSG952]|uniref:(2,3-dihydroxybenzoyl)adenylate synthase n=1 Tax=Roseibium sp. RKSG952 TaxID=2529384 RepID=UPI0012BCE7B2|nr:(2,3-dihydroxybenzoyl)adenylate synthase [Roseibium sp. RKSG952]MTH96591.1 (2,3-dihydroxybenzoyl)adenylate synthase [Roseibium sp. RKSG952]